MPQYIKEKEVDYLGYGMETILSLVAQLHTWTVITNAERMATKVDFIAPWSDSPNQHLSAYAWHLTRQKNNAKKYDVKITNNDKVMQLVKYIYDTDILEDSVMEKWEENGNRKWANTVKHFVKEYGVATRAAEWAAQRAGFESAAALREHDIPSLPHENASPSAAPGPSTGDYDAITAIAKSLEQDNHELRSVGGRSIETTSLSDIPETAASAIATNATTAMMKEMRLERKETAV